MVEWAICTSGTRVSVDCPTQVIRSDDDAGNQVFFQKAELTIFLDLP